MNAVPRELDFPLNRIAELGNELLERVDAMRQVDPILWSDINQVWMITGHAEVIQVTFDPSVVAYREILEVFFTLHDPTTLNRQGNDVGTQYRSAVFYHSEEQRRIATETIAEFNREKIWDRPIVTEVTAAQTFYPAEDYHQEYYVNNPGQGYCQIIIAPKVAKFRQKFLSKLKRA